MYDFVVGYSILCMLMETSLLMVMFNYVSSDFLSAVYIIMERGALNLIMIRDLSILLVVLVFFLLLYLDIVVRFI